MGFDLEQYYKEKEQSIIKIIIKKWEKIDYQLFINKSKKFKVVKIKERKLITKYGVINYKRRIYSYFNIKTNKIEYVSLLDRYLKIEKYKRLSQDVRDHIINFLGDGKRYRDIKDTLSNINISLMTISNIFKNHTVEKKKIDKIRLQDKQNLYINIDDCFVTSKINNLATTCKIRPVSFSTGIYIKNNRKALANKRISFELKISNEVNKSYYLNRKKSKIWIINELNKYYENWENANLVVCGDGASSWNTIAKQLNAKQVLSKFHVTQHARNSFLIINNNKYKYVDYECYKNFWKALNTFNLNLAIETLEIYCAKLKAKKIFLGKFRKARIFINYIKNNLHSFANYSKNWNIGVSAESDVFHLVKQVVNGRTYNFATLNNILQSKSILINSRK